MNAWLTRHAHALLSSAGQLARAPLATLLTLIVMSLALALPLALNTLVGNLRLATGDFSGAIGLTAYFKPEISETQARQLRAKAAQRRGVAQAELITADQGLAEMKAAAGFGAALEALEQNPLPHVLVVTTTLARSATADVEALRNYLGSWPEVEDVQLDREWVARFGAILLLLSRALLVIIVLLGAGVIAIVGNTVRLEIQNRRAEIEVTKLVGGTNAFVRRPFLYTGSWYGLLAALTAWVIVLAVLAALAAPVARLAVAYGSGFELRYPGFRELQLLLAAGVSCGWLGAFLATARHLARIEPRS